MKTDPFLDKYFYITGWVVLALIVGILTAVRFGVLERLGGLPPCVMHSTTGLYCPGCGGTRAVSALLHGHPLRSFFYHPIVLYTAIFGGWFLLSQTVERLSRGKLRIGMHYRDIYLWIALAVVLVNWVVKNLILLIGGVALMD